MAPDNNWFPDTTQARALWLHQFTMTMFNIGQTIGFSPEELAQLKADDDWLMFFAGISHGIERFSRSVDDYCAAVTEGEPGDTLPTFMPEIALPPKDSIPKPGIYRRLDEMVERIQSSPHYTHDLARLLHLEPEHYRTASMEISDAAA